MVYLSGEGLSPSTLNRYKASISGFCSHLERMDIIASNPCRKVRTPTIERKMPRYYSVEEEAKLLVAAKYVGIYYEVLIAIRTGMRRGEIRISKFEHFDFVNKLVYVPKAKGKRYRSIPMHKDLFELQLLGISSGYIFHQKTANEPQNIKRWNYKFNRLKKIVGFHFEIDFRKCRSHFGSRAVQNGIHIQKVQSWLGHADVSTTVKHYANIAAGKYDPEIDKL